MSGIYIKGMEMPKSCWDCFACHDGWCIINQKIEGHRTVTHSCPLISVPQHGRLIDADALKESAYDSGQWANAAVGYHQIVVDIEDIDNAHSVRLVLF